MNISHLYLVVDFFHLFDGVSHDLTELVELDLLLGNVILNAGDLRRVFFNLLRQVLHVLVGRRDSSVQLDDVLLLSSQFVTDTSQTGFKQSDY